VRTEWVLKWPGQAVLCVSTTYWTTLIHEAFAKKGNALANYLELNNKQINEVVALVRGKLSKQNRVTLGKHLFVFPLFRGNVKLKSLKLKKFEMEYY